ncbi:MAG: hypothetical protein SXQ77_11150 [Halobacteria archaeon]|nr:hypothetical protein [Halobacteria archaeon]
MPPPDYSHKGRRGNDGRREGWRVTFHIEADVKSYELQQTKVGYDEAIDYLIEIAQNFNNGVYDFEDFYAEGDVRHEYVERLRKETGNN